MSDYLSSYEDKINANLIYYRNGSVSDAELGAIPTLSDVVITLERQLRQLLVDWLI